MVVKGNDMRCEFTKVADAEFKIAQRLCCVANCFVKMECQSEELISFETCSCTEKFVINNRIK